MTDHLSSLPQSNEHASDTDMNVVQSIFGNQNTSEKGILSTKNLKKLLFLGIVFMVISLPFIESVMRSMFPNTCNFIFLFMKTLVFLAIVVLGQFFQLA